MQFPHDNRRFSSLLDDIEVPAFVLAPLLALLLASAIFLPIKFARTSWSYETMGIIDSPEGYVSALSPWGCIACIALVIGIWRHRWSWIAMLVAAAGFAGAAAVCVGYWLQLTRGIVLADGTSRVPDGWITHSPPALPLSVIAATVGLESALTLVSGSWHARLQE